ncbi:anhydro-N-acetylmuramic acid kinase [Nocardia tenerifensis]|uniref:Anhydro-N-acetylmuramic acid kinase n=1 Tax=Nocardia tenerifensis TaxID=228006 RepID=A0A318KLR2_9NOCA|nr:anhydro-N-acetylmuramic acid kinase [Nocardia tenerifensis]PXX69397.1 anhydro-N-acetylmuramic acid kinase [Nocardia tenerifensis]
MRVIGLMSGTSIDAIDAVGADIQLRDGTIHVEVAGQLSRAYPESLRAELIAALPPGRVELATVCRLDTAIGQEFAAVADAAAREIFGGTADLVASHGQTVYHWVSGGKAYGTLQLGQPAWIAERTGLPVVSDFRSRDIAAGGQGAPLVALFDLLWLAGRPGRSAALNIGGIANATVTGAHPVAFDTGPGNALIDAAVESATGGAEHFDRDGERAARGTVDERLLKTLLTEGYYRASPPKTTGKELFNRAYLERVLPDYPLSTDDIVATMTALTSHTVADALAPFEPDEVIVSGGGTRNPALLGMLGERLGKATLCTSDELGLPSSAKEAAAFAVLGFLTVHGLAGSHAECTGATRATVLGSITPGAARLTLPEAPDAPPRRLEVVSRARG